MTRVWFGVVAKLRRPPSRRTRLDCVRTQSSRAPVPGVGATFFPARRMVLGYSSSRSATPAPPSPPAPTASPDGASSRFCCTGAAPGQRIANVAAGKGYIHQTTRLGGRHNRSRVRCRNRRGGGWPRSSVFTTGRLHQDQAIAGQRIRSASPGQSRRRGDSGQLLPRAERLQVDARGHPNALSAPADYWCSSTTAAGAGWFTERSDQASHHALDPKYVDAELRASGFEIVKRRNDSIVQPYAQWLVIVARPSVDHRSAR